MSMHDTTSEPLLRTTQGAARIRLDPDEYARLRAAGVLVTDAQRSLPLPFDGRFFAAADWIREQSYFLRRQADFGRAVGAGVAAGLEVSRGASATALRVQPGHGLTPAGELVLLDEAVTVDVGDIARMLSLSQALGLSGVPHHPARTRSGLFVLALRPVEFTANAVASYPTTLDGARALHHGDIVEGVVVTLIPFPDPGSALEGDQRRGRVARAVFLDRGGDLGVPEALPLAMVALRRGVIDWVDPYLVRRELGTDREDVLGLGRGRRAARVAHVHQYHDQLDELVADQGAQPFAAASHFDVLPPAGRLPRSAVDASALVQRYFPITMDVRLVAVPEAELPVLVEEALRLPVLDLGAPAEVQAATTVFVLVPVRLSFHQLRATLGSAEALSLAAPTTAHRAGAPLARALASGGMSLATTTTTRAPAPALATAAAAQDWRQLLAATDELWYVRARVQHLRSLEPAGSVPVLGDEFGTERTLVQYLKRIELYEVFHHLKTAGSAEADLEMVRLLAAPRFYASKLLTAGALYELQRQKPLGKRAVLEVARRYVDVSLGEGLARIEAGGPGLTTNQAIRVVGKALVVPELDRLGALLTAAEAADLGKKLEALAQAGDSKTIQALVVDALKERGL